ncbi:MAG TPA: V-type ATP synthase subunit E, partial [Coriobacteriia bacterium]
MAIEDIFVALEEQGEQESREAVEAAREQAKGIKEDAEAQAKAIRDGRVEAAKAHATLVSARTVNSARLNGRRAVAGVKERAIVTAFDEALAKLGSVRAGAGYPALFRALAEEAVAGLTGDVVVLVDPADEALAAEFLKSSGLVGSVDPTGKTLGGLTVVAKGGDLL